MSIDWSDPKSSISNHFSVGEATWLPSWKIYHTPSEEEQANIIRQAQKMDQVRDLVGKPIKVHCWIRPTSVNCPGNENDGGNYNALVGGAPASAHVLGLATDWDCGEDCNDTRATLLPHLENLDIRMENHDGPWVHVDCTSPHPNRYFIP